MVTHPFSHMATLSQFHTLSHTPSHTRLFLSNPISHRDTLILYHTWSHIPYHKGLIFHINLWSHMPFYTGLFLSNPAHRFSSLLTQGYSYPIPHMIRISYHTGLLLSNPTHGYTSLLTQGYSYPIKHMVTHLFTHRATLIQYHTWLLISSHI